MTHFQREELNSGVFRFTSDLTWRKARQLMADDDDFGTELSQAITSVPFRALRWETLKITKAAESYTPFEFVCINSPALAGIKANEQSFKKHFSVADGVLAVSFPNLGGDAHLVVPTGHKDGADYAHLASFLRTSDKVEERPDFWKLVGKTLSEQLENADPEIPFWVSTAGFGVSWLHVRIDTRPKYYSHKPYRD